MASDLTQSSNMSRRQLLKIFGASALALSSPELLAASFRIPERRLKLHNLHTGEHIDEVFWADGQYHADGIRALNKLLRDHRSNMTTKMDTKLFNTLIQLQDKLGFKGEIEVVSGYRSEKTNEILRQTDHKVSRNSLHIQGKAVDIRLPGFEVHQTFKGASQLRAGGVGKYPDSTFVHIDTGRVRYWG